MEFLGTPFPVYLVFFSLPILREYPLVLGIWGLFVVRVLLQKLDGASDNIPFPRSTTVVADHVMNDIEHCLAKQFSTCC